MQPCSWFQVTFCSIFPHVPGCEGPGVPVHISLYTVSQVSQAATETWPQVTPTLFQAPHRCVSDAEIYNSPSAGSESSTGP